MDAEDTMLEQVLGLCESLAALTRSLLDPAASIGATEATVADFLQAATERKDIAAFG